MVECARDFMIFIDVITFLLGLAVIAAGVYVIITLQDAAFPVTDIYIEIGIGLALIFISFLGCFATRRGNSIALVFYLIIVIGALAAQIAAAILTANFLGAVKGITVPTTIISNTFNHVLVDSMLSVYTNCCSGCPNSTALPDHCNNIPSDLLDKSTSFCNITANVICANVPQCINVFNPSDANVTGCFFDVKNYPPYQYVPQVCEVFKRLSNGSIPIVGPADLGSCGAGSPVVFENQIVAFANQNGKYFIIAFSILAALQAINIIVGLTILCCSSNRKY